MNENEQKEQIAAVITAGRILKHSPELVAEDLMELGYRKVERGEWKPITNYIYGWRCSLCNKEIYSHRKSEVNRYKYPFCPNCGADMRGAEK